MITPDSSVTIAAAATWHESHQAALSALAGEEAVLIAHVGIETIAALSRMPKGHRLSPEVVLGWLERRFDPGSWLTLPGDAARDMLTTAVRAGVRGGALYDALIASTAAYFGHRLISLDRRANATYAAVGVDVEFLLLR